MHSNRPTHLLFLLAATALLFASCGKNDEPAAGTDEPSDGIRAIRITANDQMRFSLSEIKASPGEEIRLTLANIGQMPKENMAHNWVLFEQMPDRTLSKIVMDASGNAPDYLPADRSSILVKTSLLGPGETETITFTVPEAPGIYPFTCTFPAHFTSMRGNLIVE